MTNSLYYLHNHNKFTKHTHTLLDWYKYQDQKPLSNSIHIKNYCFKLKLWRHCNGVSQVVFAGCTQKKVQRSNYILVCNKKL